MLSSPRITGLLLLLCCSSTVTAILQTAQLTVELSNGVAYDILVSQASFGAYPKQGVENNSPHRLALAPNDNPLLCQNVTTPSSVVAATDDEKAVYMLVPRGECTFETKAMNAQRLGAVGVIVEGSLASRYSLNKTKDAVLTEEDIIFPTNLQDYDCDKGHADIPASAISMTPLPYNAKHNDPILSGDSAANLCLSHSPTKLQDCPSKACLLTGNKTLDGNSLQACCAWDLAIWLYNDPIFNKDDVVIPAVYVTVAQGLQLRQEMMQSPVKVTMSARIRSNYNVSALLIWALGVFVATLAAYLSASDYRTMTKWYTQRGAAAGSSSSNASSNGGDDQHSEAMALTPAARLQQPIMASSSGGEETLELSAEHALGFIVMASSGLLILFFFKVRLLQCSWT